MAKLIARGLRPNKDPMQSHFVFERVRQALSSSPTSTGCKRGEVHSKPDTQKVNRKERFVFIAARASSLTSMEAVPDAMSFAGVICVQEQRLLPNVFSKLAEHLKKSGLKVHGGPAAVTEKERASGGALVLMKQCLKSWAQLLEMFCPGA